MANSNFKYNGSDLDSLMIKKSEIYTSLDKQLWAWGYNATGALGLGNTTQQSSPVQVGTLTNWDSMSVGYEYMAAIKTDGTLWAWGSNTYGQLGQNNTTSYSSPVQVGSLTNWSRVALGDVTTAAIKTDGTLWVWGSNGSGQLGLGDTTNRSSPVQVGSLTNWSQVASVGPAGITAIKTDGTLWAWGSNSWGILGLNNTTSYSSPVQVGSLTNWSKLSDGESNHCVAVKTDGTLWVWGYNADGQLGQGNTTHQSSPVQIGSLTTWSNTSRGRQVTLAIKTDGTLWGWGAQTFYGTLGVNNMSSYSSPVQIGSLTNWNKISVSYERASAIKTDGTLWGWGNNTNGQLGLNNMTNYSSPVQVGTLTNWVDVRTARQTTGAIKTFV